MTETKKPINKKTIIGAIALVAVVAVLGIAYAVFGPKTTAGEKSITIEVIDNEQKSVVYEVDTEAEFLEQAFADAEGLEVSGPKTEFGLTIETVNGLTADFNKSSAYWSIMVNGEYGQAGASTQPVTDGDEFQLVYSVFVAE